MDGPAALAAMLIVRLPYPVSFDPVFVVVLY